MRFVSLETRALSAMATLTVRISPTRRARWSWKKLRAPARHSEFGEGWVISSGGLSIFWSVGTRAEGKFIAACWGLPSVSLISLQAPRLRTEAVRTSMTLRMSEVPLRQCG